MRDFIWDAGAGLSPTPPSSPQSTSGLAVLDVFNGTNLATQLTDTGILGLTLTNNGVIYNSAGNAFLSVIHHAVDEFCNRQAVVYRVRHNFSFFCTSSSRHSFLVTFITFYSLDLGFIQDLPEGDA